MIKAMVLSLSLVVNEMWLLLLSCIQESSEPECLNSTQCDGLCIDGECISVECLGNLDCPFQEQCVVGTCQEGCSQAGDCLAGQECVEGVCQQDSSCRTAQLDCKYGEDCIEGSCVPSSFPNCQPCTFEDWQNTPNGEQECIIYTYSLEQSCSWPAGECAGDYSCYPTDQVGDVQEGFCIASYFFQPCQQDADCPRPMFCKEDIYQDGSNLNVCWADCPFWREQGVF